MTSARREPYADVGRATRAAIDRACAQSDGLSRLDWRVLAAVIAQTTTWSRTADFVYLAALACTVYATDDAEQWMTKKIGQSLRRLRDLGVLGYIPARGAHCHSYVDLKGAESGGLSKGAETGGLSHEKGSRSRSRKGPDLGTESPPPHAWRKGAGIGGPTEEDEELSEDDDEPDACTAFAVAAALVARSEATRGLPGTPGAGPSAEELKAEAVRVARVFVARYGSAASVAFVRELTNSQSDADAWMYPTEVAFNDCDDVWDWTDDIARWLGLAAGVDGDDRGLRLALASAKSQGGSWYDWAVEAGRVMEHLLAPSFDVSERDLARLDKFFSRGVSEMEMWASHGHQKADPKICLEWVARFTEIEVPSL